MNNSIAKNLHQIRLLQVAQASGMGWAQQLLYFANNPYVEEPDYTYTPNAVDASALPLTPTNIAKLRRDADECLRRIQEKRRKNAP